MLEPIALITLHTVMMWSIAAVFWMVCRIERRWNFPCRWPMAFTLMPAVLLIALIAEMADHDLLRLVGMTVGVVGAMMWVDGLRLFVRVAAPLRLVIAGAVFFMLGEALFIYGAPSLPGRIAVFVVTVTAGSGYALWLTRFLPTDDHALGRPLAWATGVVTILSCLALTAALALGYLDMNVAVATGQAMALIVVATVVGLFKAMVCVVLVAERMAAQLGREARVDCLTGLATRRVFEENLNDALARRQRDGRPVSVILFDVDYFKGINDSHGHDVGDVALQRVADCARAAIRATDLAARLGGDEFAVLLPDTDAEAAEVVARRILEEMRRVALISPNGAVTLTGSFGVGAATGAMAAAALVKRADDALYVVKRKGRNDVFAAA